MRIRDIPEIAKLSTPEKILLVEDLWDDLAGIPEQVPVYAWQKRELERRKTNLMNNPASGLHWEQVKKRIRQFYGRLNDFRPGSRARYHRSLWLV